MDRATKLFLLLTCPLLACSDDLPTPADGSTSGEDGTTTTPVTVTVSPTMTDSDTGSGTTDSGVDSTGTTTDDMGTSSSSEGGATESSSDGGSSSSSSGGMSSSSSDGGMSSSSDGGSSSSSGGPSCGDGVIDMGEDCDGMALGGETCVSQGATIGGQPLAQGRVVNDYWADPHRGIMWMSRQWAGPDVGYLRIRRLIE